MRSLDCGVLELAAVARFCEAFGDYEVQDGEGVGPARELVDAARPVLLVCRGVDVTALFAPLDAAELAADRAKGLDNLAGPHLREAVKAIVFRIAEDIVRLLGDAAKDEETVLVDASGEQLRAAGNAR